MGSQHDPETGIPLRHVEASVYFVIVVEPWLVSLCNSGTL